MFLLLPEGYQLRFACIRVSASGEGTILTAETLPEPVWRTGR